MYTFLTQFIDILSTHKLHYFVVFFFVVWLRWFVVSFAALFYKPYHSDYKCTKSVIIPVVDEDPLLFRQVLASINKQRPFETIVVINGPRNEALEKVCQKYSRISCYWTSKPGKRNALRYGLLKATGDIVVLVDSDTVWHARALKELVKPFADPQVGGVTTRQEINNPEANLISRVCSWLENVRTSGSMPAMSITGKVGCLPGRTIAFRHSILKTVMPEFMNETFLGFHKEVSDDRSLTNLTLKLGYKTVLQSTSVVSTEAPETWKKFLRQQLRWSEGSQYNNLRMSSWMFKHARLTFFIYWTDMLIPFLLWGVYGAYLFALAMPAQKVGITSTLIPQNIVVLMVVTILGAYFSYTLRHLNAAFSSWKQFVYLPAYILFLSFVLAPIRIIGFAKLADDLGWGTRSNAYKSKNTQEAAHATA